MRPDDGELRFAILGRRLTARRAAAPLKAWLQQMWLFPECDLPDHASTITLDVLAAAPAPLAGTVPAPATLDDRTLNFQASGAEWELREGGGGVRFALARDGARIAAWGLGGGERAAPLYLAIQVAMTEALRASGLLPLHAAVAAHGADVVAFLGGRGSGKSSTVLHAARSGWRPIAEDLCWIDPAGLAVCGWDRAIRARPDALERFFPDLRDAPATPDGRRLVPYDRVATAAPRRATLSRLALLARAPGSASRWDRAQPSDVVKALWEASGVPLHEPSRQLAAGAIARLSRAVPAARLVLGTGWPPLDLPAAGGLTQG